MTRIIPITELRNTNEISKEAHRINEPIFLTCFSIAALFKEDACCIVNKYSCIACSEKALYSRIKLSIYSGVYVL